MLSWFESRSGSLNAMINIHVLGGCMRTGKSQIVVKFAELSEKPVMILPSDYINAGINEIDKNNQDIEIKDTEENGFKFTIAFVYGWLIYSLRGGYNLDIILEGPWFLPNIINKLGENLKPYVDKELLS